MKRTTIMLPETLRRRAASHAKQRGISLGELIRDSLDKTLPPGLRSFLHADSPAIQDLPGHDDPVNAV